MRSSCLVQLQSKMCWQRGCLLAARLILEPEDGDITVSQ
jgi:hypothetical protein